MFISLSAWHAIPFTGKLACMIDATVISVEYGNAPEVKAPNGALNCYAALKWVLDNAEQLDIDPEHVAIGG